MYFQIFHENSLILLGLVDYKVIISILQNEIHAEAFSRPAYYSYNHKKDGFTQLS